MNDEDFNKEESMEELAKHDEFFWSLYTGNDDDKAKVYKWDTYMDNLLGDRNFLDQLSIEELLSAISHGSLLKNNQIT